MDEYNYFDISKQLSSLEFLLIISNIEKIITIIDKIFDNEEKLTVYNLTDGEKSSVDIAEVVDVTQQTVSNWWNAWKIYGLVIPGPIREDRPKKLLDLEVIRNLACMLK